MAEWKRLAKKWNVTGTLEELGSPIKISSASKFEYENFLGLQVPYKFPQEGTTLPAAITRQFPSDSDNHLEDLPGFKTYLTEIENARVHSISKDSIVYTRISPELQAFINVWQLQMHVLVGDEPAIDVPKVSPASSIAKKTGAKIGAKQFEQAPVTPTPASRSQSMSLPKVAAVLSLNEGAEFENDGDSEEDTIDDDLPEDAEDSSDNDDDDDDIDEDPSMPFPRVIFPLLEHYWRVILCPGSSDSISGAKSH